MKFLKIVFLLPFFLSPSALSEDYSHLSREVLNVFVASKEVLFEKQPLINSAEADKTSLFGQAFLLEVGRVYQKNYGKPLPAADHPVKVLLYQSILSVLEDNRALIMDRELAYKGFIPATFSFQLSQRFSNSGYPVKIKFVGLKGRLVNQINAPDAWEESVLASRAVESLQEGGVIQELTLENERSLIRSLQPIYISQACLSCHGSVADNPKNNRLDKKDWTRINTAGFEMQDFQLGELAGGIGLIIDVFGVQEGGGFDLR